MSKSWSWLVAALSSIALSSGAGPAEAQFVVTLAVVSPGDREVGTVNPATGVVSLPGGPINGGMALASVSGVNTFDPSGNRLFFIGFPDGVTPNLYSINALTGAELASPVLSGGSTTISGLEWDDAEGVLYALVSVASDRQLATIAPATGVVTLLGAPIAGTSLGSVSGADDLDAGGNRYFFAGQPMGGNPKIYAVNTATGAVLTNPDLSGAAINALLGLEYDAGEGVLYGLASVGAGDRQIATVNPGTGAVTLLGAPIAGEGLSSTSGADTLDPAGNRYLFAGQPTSGNPKIYAVSTTTGAVLTNPDLSGDSTSLPGLEWEPAQLPVELLTFEVE